MMKLHILRACDLKQRITTAVVSDDEDMLKCVWNKLDYSTDIMW